ncbi:HNH endonuclease [Brachybacterium sp. AOP29-B2-41]|uniref:HNH endonuclease n=1 Tax=Brachybacterium sp. AOP29-B2-41 TaxID=3457704 RepID=UPI00403484AF
MTESAPKLPAEELPEPYSEELKASLRHRGHGSPAHQHIYACLYERSDSPPTDSEISEYVFQQMGIRHSQLQRRRRQIGEVFLIKKEPGHRYRLAGRLPKELSQATSISQKVRFSVLKSGRCRLCGRSAATDGVSLVVDHILPQAWGGTDLEENLQPLCTECNAGKKDYYGDFDQYSELIQKAASAEEPHRRIALLLHAFDGTYVPSELLGAVASAKQYQEDWQKRTRELREIGIDYETKKRKLPSGRFVTDWRLTKWTDLPSEPLAPLIRRNERRKKNDNH